MRSWTISLAACTVLVAVLHPSVMPPQLLDPRTPLIGAPGTVADFWQWTYSDLLATRRVTEFL